MFYALKKKFLIPTLHFCGYVNYDLPIQKVNPYLDEVFVIDRQAPFKEKKELVKLLKVKFSLRNCAFYFRTFYYSPHCKLFVRSEEESRTFISE